MAVPALIYLAITGGAAEAARAAGRSRRRPTSRSRSACWRWLGPRVPASLKLFLTTVAIVDDMGAVAIIAVFYTHGLALAALGGGGGGRWR